MAPGAGGCTGVPFGALVIPKVPCSMGEKFMRGVSSCRELSSHGYIRGITLLRVVDISGCGIRFQCQQLLK